MLDQKALTLEHFNQLKSLETVPYSEIKEIQKSKLLDLIKFARSNNPLYRKLLPDIAKLSGDISLETLLDLIPIMNRKFLQDNFKDLMIFLPGTDEVLYGYSSTSGSTGQPVQVFKYLPEYLKSYYAATLLEWDWHQRDIHKPMGTFRLGGKDIMQQNIGPPITFIGTPAPGFQYRSDGRSVQELVEALINHKPAYVFCNVITLRLIIKEVLTGNYPKIEVDQILSVSDLVDENFREQAKAAFGARVVDRYSTEELGLMAVECATDSHMHLMAPDFITEILDHDGNRVSPGGSGQVVMTPLNNPAMPLFRYELGDEAVLWDGTCAAGISWPSLASVTGRIRDYVEYPDGRKNIATFVKSDIVTLPDLYDFQAVLFTDTIMLIAGVKSPLAEESKRTIRTELQRIFGDHLTVVIKESTQLPLLKPVKRAEFIRHQKPFWDTANYEEYLEQEKAKF